MNFDDTSLHSFDEGDDMIDDIDENLDEDFDDDMIIGDLDEVDADMDMANADMDMDDDLDDIAPPPPRRSRSKGSTKVKKPLVCGLVDADKLNNARGREKAWQKLAPVIDDANPITYSPRATINIGDVITHPRFGVGVVVNLESPQKAAVLFEDDLRRLVCNKGEQRPARSPRLRDVA